MWKLLIVFSVASMQIRNLTENGEDRGEYFSRKGKFNLLIKNKTKIIIPLFFHFVGRCNIHITFACRVIL